MLLCDEYMEATAQMANTRKISAGRAGGETSPLHSAYGVSGRVSRVKAVGLHVTKEERPSTSQRNRYDTSVDRFQSADSVSLEVLVSIDCGETVRITNAGLTGVRESHSFFLTTFIRFVRFVYRERLSLSTDQSNIGSNSSILLLLQ